MRKIMICLLLACLLSWTLDATQAIEELSFEQCLRQGEQAYVRGDCVKAMVLFTRAVAIDPDNRDALERLEFVADELQFLDEHYKEWLRIMSETEAEQSREFEEKVDEAITVLRTENTQRISELRRDSIRYIGEKLRRQDATIERLERKLDQFRLLAFGIVFLGVGVFAFRRRRGRR